MQPKNPGLLSESRNSPTQAWGPLATFGAPSVAPSLTRLSGSARLEQVQDSAVGQRPPRCLSPNSERSASAPRLLLSRKPAERGWRQRAGGPGPRREDAFCRSHD